MLRIKKSKIFFFYISGNSTKMQTYDYSPVRKSIYPSPPDITNIGGGFLAFKASRSMFSMSGVSVEAAEKPPEPIIASPSS